MVANACGTVVKVVVLVLVLVMVLKVMLVMVMVVVVAVVVVMVVGRVAVAPQVITTPVLGTLTELGAHPPRSDKNT